MKIGILGSGAVAQSLGAGFLKYGHEVKLGTRTASKLDDWKRKHPKGIVGSFSEAAAFGELLVLAVKGTVASEVLRAAGYPNLQGKIVLDTTNPMKDAPPEKGLIKYFTTFDASLMERLQAEVPAARFVKCFSTVGSESMVDPAFKGGRPSMFICGNDAAAKATTAEILDRFGWDTEDCGGVEGARAIEPLAMVWCIPGFLRNDWVHAFKILR